MYDALFVHLAQELELPILTSDTRLSRADGAGGSSPGNRIRLTDPAL
jgi:predicted nucleic acid-binding protein